MKIFPTGKLADFFRYYDPTNKQHVAAVLRLQDDLEETDPKLVCDSAAWVKIFREQIQNYQNAVKPHGVDLVGYDLCMV